MPLDASRVLSAQGWGGNGHPLRPNSNGIRKPVILAQKRTLGGVGKDRDTAFAFWDHVYAASAKTIQIKLHPDSDTEDSSSASPEIGASSDLLSISRTSTGLISHRQPQIGDTVSLHTVSRPTLSLMAVAKREAARKGLYARFYRGPVVGSSEEVPSPSLIPPVEEPVAGPSTMAAISSRNVITIGSPAVQSEAIVVPPVSNATIEEDEVVRGERKAAKKARKAEREERRRRKEERRRLRELKLEKEAAEPATAMGSLTPILRKRKREGGEDGERLDATRRSVQAEGQPHSSSNPEPERPKKKKKEKYKDGRTDTLDSSSSLAQAVSPRPPATTPVSKPLKKRVSFCETVQQRVVTRWL